MPLAPSWQTIFFVEYFRRRLSPHIILGFILSANPAESGLVGWWVGGLVGWWVGW
ncbi:MAG: hypothetical protein ACPGWR_09880 [Ardenticatenaceae bacterium]